MATYPENADGVERTERWPIGLDHTEHTMKLPVDKEYNEQVMRIPEPFKVSPTAFLHRVPHHNTQRKPHDPTSQAGASEEVGRDEVEYNFTSSRRCGIQRCQFREIDHVRCCV